MCNDSFSKRKLSCKSPSQIAVNTRFGFDRFVSVRFGSSLNRFAIGSVHIGSVPLRFGAFQISVLIGSVLIGREPQFGSGSGRFHLSCGQWTVDILTNGARRHLV